MPSPSRASPRPGRGGRGERRPPYHRPMDGILEAAAQLKDRRRILVFTGAGISTESGIPDFRGPQGVWTTVDPDEFTLERYLRYPETRRRSWQMRMNSGALDAEPNAAHRAVVDLWRTGRMIGCVTQNIDGLHQKAGLPDEAVAELHGNAQTTVCLECGHEQPTADVLRRGEAGEDDPPRPGPWAPPFTPPSTWPAAGTPSSSSTWGRPISTAWRRPASRPPPAWPC